MEKGGSLRVSQPWQSPNHIQIDRQRQKQRQFQGKHGGFVHVMFHTTHNFTQVFSPTVHLCGMRRFAPSALAGFADSFIGLLTIPESPQP